MIKFKSISIQNFLSYGNIPTLINLDTQGTTFIVGQNLDDTTLGINSNGCGKSIISNSLAYVLYNEPISKVSSLDNLINDKNKKNLEVIVLFEKDNVNYEIKRTRKGKKGNSVTLLIEGEDKTPDSIGNTDKKIVEILGIPYDLFVRIVTFNAELPSFFSLPASHATQTNQKDIIEELFNLKILTQKAEILKKKISDTEKSLDTHMIRHEMFEKELAKYQIQLTNAEQRVETWDIKNKNNIGEITQELKSILGIDYDLERKKIEEYQVFKTESSLKITELNTTKNGSSLKSNELKILESNKTTKESKKKILDKTIAGYNKDISTQANIIEHEENNLTLLDDNKCPYCSQKFEDNKIKIKESISLIQAATEKLNNINLSVATTNIEISKIDSEIKQDSVVISELKQEIASIVNTLNQEVTLISSEETTLKKKLMFSTLEQLLQSQNKQSVLETKINELTESINPYIDPLVELKSQKPERIDMTEINKLTSLIEHQKFLLKLLTKKDSFIRKALLNKTIPFLNQRLVKYIYELGLPHKVEFTHEMTAHITQFGTEKDFGLLSNGQRARINIALSFAFRDVLQTISNKINVCLLDEVLDIGLDIVGIQAATKMIKKKAREEQLSLFVISHRELDTAMDFKMIVQMSKGFSNIVYEQ